MEEQPIEEISFNNRCSWESDFEPFGFPIWMVILAGFILGLIIG